MNSYFFSHFPITNICLSIVDQPTILPTTCSPEDDDKDALYGNHCIIYPHWRQYPPPPYPFHASIGLLMFFMFVAGSLGNALVLVVYNRWVTSRLLLGYIWVTFRLHSGSFRSHFGYIQVTFGSIQVTIGLHMVYIRVTFRLHFVFCILCHSIFIPIQYCLKVFVFCSVTKTFVRCRLCYLFLLKTHLPILTESYVCQIHAPKQSQPIPCLHSVQFRPMLTHCQWPPQPFVIGRVSDSGKLVKDFVLDRCRDVCSVAA